MSLPSFPVVNPPIEREDAVNQILSSIAMEELGLSHILNAEGEKLQYILGTLPGLSGPPATADFAANTQGSSVLVALGGSPIPLPNAQVLSPDITANTGNTVFTVATAGTYQISYHVNTTVALLMGTRLVINGVNSIPSTINPVVSTSNFENQIKVTLPANSTITLQLFTTIAGTAILVSGGAGASLTIIRLS